MNSTNHYYAAIFGAGIAGTALANELNKKGKQVVLIDPFVSEDAPGAPAGLVNPATGPRAKICWQAEKCYAALRSQIEELQKFNDQEDLISDTGVLRPAINKKLAKNYKKSLDKYDWPEGWISWLDEEEITERNPEIAPNHGGLSVDCGYTVFVDRYLNTYRKFLRKNGVTCKYERADYKFTSGESQCSLRFEDGSECTADHVIIAAGFKTPDFEEWASLPTELVKGQLVWYEATEDLPWEHAVAAKGYTMRRGSRSLLTGATYEHNFEHLDTTEEASERIWNKLDIMFADMQQKVDKKLQMAGVRVTTPNRLPIIGRHPDNDKLCVYTGMNSKGLLFSHHVAEILSDHLVAGVQIPEELSVARF